ncbi:MAG: hypothetical protein RQ885_07135 [Desulfurococcales archaeon]|nr:hypothetical protein [Desulfurococcales archaeon]
MSSPQEIMLEAQRLVERGEVRKALQMLISLIPPGEDYGVELASSPTISYYLDRGGLISISKRVEESLPYITSTARKIPWDLLPSWVFEELDFCRVMKDIVRINFEWLSKEGRRHPYEKIAREVISIDTTQLCGGSRGR